MFLLCGDWKHDGVLGTGQTSIRRTGRAVQAGNVTCNAVCPGYMLTELVEKQLAATAKLRGMSEVCCSFCFPPAFMRTAIHSD